MERISLSGFRIFSLATKVLFFSLNLFSLLRPGLDFLFSGMELLFETGKVSDCLSCNGLGVGR